MPKCQHNKCGKEYNEDDNLANACCHHPGVPVFHDGLKGWSCCEKRFVEFQDFMDHAGCTLGMHTDVKPVVEAPDAEGAAAAAAFGEAETEIDRKPLDMAKRVRKNGAKTEVAVKITAALQKAFDRQSEAVAKEEGDRAVQVGQACVNNACKTTYQGEETDAEQCKFHPGGPIFHEGMKYWSCCSRKKFFEFEEFLSHPGCEVGSHRWFKNPSELAKEKECRIDMFQTESHVVVSIFAKVMDPGSIKLAVSADSLTLKMLFEKTNTANMDLLLFGDIVPDATTAEAKSMKLELKMTKAEPINWDTLSVA